MDVTIVCNICKKAITVTVDTERYTKWRDGEGYIQDMLPELDAGQRELLISNICEPCFDSMFGGE